MDNVAPTVGVSGSPLSVDEGSGATVFSLTLGTVVDPGSDTVSSWVVDWGDGSADTYSSGGVKTHTYAAADLVDDGSFGVSVDLVDEDATHTDAGSASFGVDNVAPSFVATSLPADETIDEGGSSTAGTVEFGDPALGNDSYTVTVAWGDGSTSSPTATAPTSTTNGSFSLPAHTYGDDGSFTVTITVTDGDGGSVSDSSFDVTVNNVAPTFVAGSLPADETIDEGGSSTAGTVGFGDPALGDDSYTVTVDWGDGSTSSPTATAPTSAANGSFSLPAHTYGDDGSFTVTITVADGDGGSVTDSSFDVTVDNMAPTIGLSANDPVDEGSVFSLTLGTVTDPGSDTVSSWMVDWADGSSKSSNTYTSGMTKTHMYADDGSFGVVVDLVDEDGTHAGAGGYTVTVSGARRPKRAPCEVPVFGDVAADGVFAQDIAWLAGKGITRGCRADAFCPDRLVTRGQMAAFVNRTLDLPLTDVDRFGDDDGSVFEEAINRLAAAGITLGCRAGEFCPDRLVTRGQMAAFVNRALDLPLTDVDRFGDDDGSVFEEAINRLAAAGITLGCRAGEFCPDDGLTRGQMAAVLHRAAVFMNLTGFPGECDGDRVGCAGVCSR